MATFWLLNNITVGSNRLYAGTRINDAVDNVSQIQAAGGQLFATGTAVVDTAAAEAQGLRLRGGNPDDMEGIMSAAVNTAQQTSIQGQDTVDVTVQAFHETFVNPEAPATSKGTIAESAASANPTGQPTHPTNLEVVFAAGWEGGNVTVSGTLADGTAGSETFASTPGGTVVGVKAFALINAVGGITNSAVAGAADVATVQTGSLLGLASTEPIAAYKLSVDGVDEAIAAQSAANKTVTPTTAKDGAREFEVWYRASHNHTLS